MNPLAGFYSEPFVSSLEIRKPPATRGRTVATLLQFAINAHFRHFLLSCFDHLAAIAF